MGDTIAQTRFENVSKLSNDLLLAKGNTVRSGEDSLKLKELMELCTNLQQRILDLDKTKITQAEEIVSLKRRVKKLEQKKRLRTHRLKSDEVLAEQEFDAKDVYLTVDEVTLAQALAALKSVKPNVKANFVEKPCVPVSAATTTTTTTIPTPRKGIIITKLGTSTTTTISSQPSHAKVQDKGKGIMVEPENPLKKKD
ncbi:hypothetical protein Tco_1024670 [Tanacetum coccineum]